MMEMCPVGELVGEPHELSGVTQEVEWDVMGDPDNKKVVCAGCAGNTSMI